MTTKKQYIKMPNVFLKNGYKFELVKRVDDVAIFSQHMDDQIVAYEVFEIRKQQENEFNGIKYDAKEKSPANEQWGQNAYTVGTIGRAEIRMQEILESIKIREENKHIING